MLAFIVKRLLLLVPILLGVSLGVFFLVHLVPGDSVTILLGDEYTQERAAELRSQLGLDQPLAVQFLSWLGRTATGDLGASLFSGRPIVELMLSHGAVTLTLAVFATAIAVLIGVPAGVVSATHYNGWIDNIVRLLSMVGISMPVFWIGMLLILIVSMQMGLLPPGGSPANYGLRAYILPSLALGLSNAALVSRMTRSAMLDELQQDYVRTAWSKGLSPTIVNYHHAFRNAFGPVATVVGLQFGALLSSTVLVEYIFSVPGIGSLLIDSVYRRDIPVIQASVLFVAVAFVLTTLIVDTAQALFDPRIKQ